MTPTVWTHCYADGWEKGDICEAAWSHPAKYSKALIFRIIQHLVRQSYVSRGQVVLDPFGGVALGALPCMAYGLSYVGVELEPRFHATGLENLALWRQRYGYKDAQFLQGDSRHLRAVLGEAGIAACVGSPPFGSADSAGPESLGKRTDKSALAMRQTQGWGIGGQNAPGNLATLPPGRFEAVVSSPPFCGSTQTEHNPDNITAGKGRRGGDSAARVKQDYAALTTPGNLGTLPTGAVQAVVGSPPYVGGGHHNGQMDSYGGIAGKLTTGDFAKDQHGYGDTPGQLDKENPITFWSAASQILAELAALLPPGAPAVWVVKDYIKGGKRVPFCAQWEQLCHAHGFVTAEVIHASLVEEHGQQETIFGTTETQQTLRASFFRRLHMKKRPDLAIVHETVLFTVRSACL